MMVVFLKKAGTKDWIRLNDLEDLSPDEIKEAGIEIHDGDMLSIRCRGVLMFEGFVFLNTLLDAERGV